MLPDQHMNGGIVARKNLLQTIIALNSHLMYEHFMSNQLATLFVSARRWMAANAGKESEKISRTFLLFNCWCFNSNCNKNNSEISCEWKRRINENKTRRQTAPTTKPHTNLYCVRDVLKSGVCYNSWHVWSRGETILLFIHRIRNTNLKFI